MSNDKETCGKDKASKEAGEEEYELLGCDDLLPCDGGSNSVKVEEFQAHLSKKNIPAHTPLQHCKFEEHNSPLTFKDEPHS
jgi:hypothetical protein